MKGRPKLPPEEKRPEYMAVRVSTARAQAVKALARLEGRSVSGFIDRLLEAAIERARRTGQLP